MTIRGRLWLFYVGGGTFSVLAFFLGNQWASAIFLCLGLLGFALDFRAWHQGRYVRRERVS